MAARVEDSFGIRTEVLIPFDLPSLNEHQVGAVIGAVGEALTNAGKHAGARHLTVFIEPDDQGRLFCSIKDDGDGFDESTVAPGIGISRSIVERMRDAGGRAEIRSRPGEGTEVCLWL